MDIEKLYREYFTPVYRYAFSLVHDPDLAEEITQETFFRALRKIDGYRGEASLKVWLCQIAKNLCFDSAKRQTKMAPLMTQGEDDAASCYDKFDCPSKAVQDRARGVNQEYYITIDSTDIYV